MFKVSTFVNDTQLCYLCTALVSVFTIVFSGGHGFFFWFGWWGVMMGVMLAFIEMVKEEERNNED